MSLRASSLAIALLVLGAPVAVRWIRPPAPAEAEEPARFSARRAAEHLAWIAAEPRPARSARGALVRERLAQELAALGFDTRLQVLSDEAAWGRAGAPARPRDEEGAETAALANVVARRAGTAGEGALLLVAHHDSVPGAYGAGDDGAALAAILEALRALGDAPRANDLIVLLTDGEELGLVGARQFAEQHPWFADVRAVLNFEGRGVGGPSILFETGPRSGGLVERYARVAPHPFGTSVAPAVYARMPNDTDFSVFRQAGLPGLNFAFLGGGAAYHRPADRREALDAGSLQQHGEAMLALLRDLGDADLDALEASGDREFFPVPGGLLRYPRRWTPLLSIVAALVVLGLCARRRPLVALGGTPAAVAVALAAAVAAAALALGATALVGLLARAAGREAVVGANLRSGELATLGLWWSALGIALALVRRRTTLAEPLARGALVAWALVAVALAHGVPGAGHVGLLALAGAALAHGTRAHVRGGAGRAALACLLWLPAALALFPLQALFVQVGSVHPTAEAALGGLACAPLVLAALPLLVRPDPRASVGLGVPLAVLGAGALALVGAAALRLAGA